MRRAAPSLEWIPGPTRRTLASEISLQGVGLHRGCELNLRLRPLTSVKGISFLRRDLKGSRPVAACFDQVTDSAWATTLGQPPGEISTVEHLMAALLVAGVDDLRVEIDGPELPILDGSALPFWRALQHTGTVERPGRRRVCRILRPIELERGDSFIGLYPAERLELDVQVEYAHPLLGTSRMLIPVEPRFFEEQLCWARTFGFARDVAKMLQLGLIRGATFENALLFSDHDIVNPEGMRGADEPLRHKLLDLIGDLALLGASLQARVVARRPGHRLSLELLRLLASEPGFSLPSSKM